MAQIKTKKLGEILVEAGTITPDKLDLALREQSQTGEKLGTIFQRLGICSEKEIAKVLASQAGVACVDLAHIQVDIEQLELVDRSYAEKYSIMPILRKGSTLQVAMANPLDLMIIDELGRRTGKYIEVLHAPDSEIQDAIVRYYGAKTGGADEITILIDKSQKALASGVKLGEGDSPFIRLVDQILRQGVEAGATDIHIEPEEKVLRCRYRVDGRLAQGPILPAELMGIVITRVKILAELNISENRVPQDGRILFDTGRRKVDLRVNTFPTVNGEGICCRILDKEALIVGLERLGMDQAMQTRFRGDLTKPNGIILVTGPTGSGKTTTLYSALTYLNKPDTKIITLEDPVEYELPVINQAQINTAKGFTFAKGLRAILRQDPDILLVGEIRDVETAQMAIRAALTGHLVFSTLHTNSAAGAIPRLLDMGVEPFLLSATLVSIIAQRLVRQVCDQCAEEIPFDAEDLEIMGLPEDYADEAINKVGKGCDLCRHTGYRGRMAVFEYLQVDKKVRKLIADGADGGTIEEAVRETGQLSLRDDALAKMKAGRTTIKEVMRVVQ